MMSYQEILLTVYTLRTWDFCLMARMI